MLSFRHTSRFSDSHGLKYLLNQGLAKPTDINSYSYLTVLFENSFAGFIFCKLFCDDPHKIFRISEAPIEVSNLVHKYTMKK